jgi:hypothetical protein
MYNICIIYTPNLGLGITVFDQERKQGRLRGSSKGARGRSTGAVREHGGAEGEQRESIREHRGSRGTRGSIIGQCRGVAGRSLKRVPQHSAQATFSIFNKLSLTCCLDLASSHRIL